MHMEEGSSEASPVRLSPAGRLRKKRRMSDIFRQLATCRDVITPPANPPSEEKQQVSHLAQRGVPESKAPVSNNGRQAAGTSNSARERTRNAEDGRRDEDNTCKSSKGDEATTPANEVETNSKHAQHPTAEDGMGMRCDSANCIATEAVEASLVKSWRQGKQHEGESSSEFTVITDDRSLIIELNLEVERGTEKEKKEKKQKDDENDLSTPSTEVAEREAMTTNGRILRGGTKHTERDVFQFRGYGRCVEDGPPDSLSKKFKLNVYQKRTASTAKERDLVESPSSTDSDNPVLSNPMLEPIAQLWKELHEDIEAQGGVRLFSPDFEFQSTGKGVTEADITEAFQSFHAEGKLKRLYRRSSVRRPCAGNTSLSKPSASNGRNEELQAAPPHASSLRCIGNGQVRERMKSHELNGPPLRTTVVERTFGAFDLHKADPNTKSKKGGEEVPSARKVRCIDLNEPPPADDFPDFIPDTLGITDRQPESGYLGCRLDLDCSRGTAIIGRKSMEGLADLPQLAVLQTNGAVSQHEQNADRSRSAVPSDGADFTDKIVKIVNVNVNSGCPMSSGGKAKGKDLEWSMSDNLKGKGTSMKKKLREEARELRQSRSPILTDTVPMACRAAKISEEKAARKSTNLQTKKGRSRNSEKEEHSQIKKRSGSDMDDYISSFSDDSDHLPLSVMIMRRRSRKKSSAAESRKSNHDTQKKRLVRNFLDPSDSYRDVYWCEKSSDLQEAVSSRHLAKEQISKSSGSIGYANLMSSEREQWDEVHDGDVMQSSKLDSETDQGHLRGKALPLSDVLPRIRIAVTEEEAAEDWLRVTGKLYNGQWRVGSAQLPKLMHLCESLKSIENIEYFRDISNAELQDNRDID